MKVHRPKAGDNDPETQRFVRAVNDRGTGGTDELERALGRSQDVRHILEEVSAQSVPSHVEEWMDDPDNPGNDMRLLAVMELVTRLHQPFRVGIASGPAEIQVLVRSGVTEVVVRAG